MRRLQGQLYVALKSYPLLEDWDSRELFALAASILESKMGDIDTYLNTYNITLKNADEAIQHIMTKILLPGIEKLRI